MLSRLSKLPYCDMEQSRQPNSDLHRSGRRLSSEFLVCRDAEREQSIWMAIFIYNLFDFFWLYTVPGNVLNVVVVPLRLQLPELHRLKLAQGRAGFEVLIVATWVCACG